MTWLPETDYIELKIQQLHFGKMVRGRLSPKTKVFKDGSSAKENFVPQKLTTRMVMSKFMSIFDLRGLLIALTARYKKDMRN